MSKGVDPIAKFQKRCDKMLQAKIIREAASSFCNGHLIKALTPPPLSLTAIEKKFKK